MTLYRYWSILLFMEQLRKILLAYIKLQYCNNLFTNKSSLRLVENCSLWIFHFVVVDASGHSRRNSTSSTIPIAPSGGTRRKKNWEVLFVFELF